MLRHSCGYALANQGRDTRVIQDYLGHRNIQIPPDLVVKPQVIDITEVM
jgi:integrase